MLILRLFDPLTVPKLALVWSPLSLPSIRSIMWKCGLRLQAQASLVRRFNSTLYSLLIAVALLFSTFLKALGMSFAWLTSAAVLNARPLLRFLSLPRALKTMNR